MNRNNGAYIGIHKACSKLPFTLVQLEYVVAVDTWRHFVTAAEHCSVTQPTLSMQIRKMEELLGVELFDRSKQPVIPTDVGEAVIAQARRILAEARQVPELVQAHQGVVEGSLRLGIIPTLSTHVLPRFLGRFLQAYPGVELHIQELETAEVVHALRKDRLDAGLVVTPLKEAGIVERPLFYEEIRAYLQQPGPEGRPVKVDELMAHRMWILTQGHCFREQVLNLCQLQGNAGSDPALSFESGSLETLRRLVDAEGGATLLPGLAALDLPADKQAHVRPLGPVPPFREISLVHARTFVKRRLLDLLTETLSETIPLPGALPAGSAVVQWR